MSIGKDESIRAAKQRVFNDLQRNENVIKEALIALGWTPPECEPSRNDLLAKRIAELTRQLSAAQEELRQVKANARRAVETIKIVLEV